MIFESFKGERPKFPEGLDLELNFKFLKELFHFFAQFKSRFPELNISLRDLFEFVEKHKSLIEEFYNSLFKLYLEGRITLEELREKIKEHPLYQEIAGIFRYREIGKISPELALGLAVILAFLGLAIIEASVILFGNFGIGQVHKLEEIKKVFENPR